MDVERFGCIAVDGRNLVVHNPNSIKSETALGAWKRRLTVLSRGCVGIFIKTQSAYMLLVRCEQDSSCYCLLRDAIEANVEVADRDCSFGVAVLVFREAIH